MKPVAVVLAVLLLALACSAGAADVVVGPAGQPASLKDALAAAQDGDVITLLPGVYGDSAVVPAKRLTLRGLGRMPVLKANGPGAEGKAILLVRGGEVTLENLEFRGARNDAANGAGVRLESGRLKVVRCRFIDNEAGLLTGNDDRAELEIDSSVFGEAPRVVGGLSHLLSVGRIGRFQISGSHFYRGFEGHLLKSRARESRITYNVIDDGNGGGASYEVDLANGGVAWLIGNVIGQGPGAQNRTVVSYGAEGGVWPRNLLYMSHNTLINRGWLPAWFLRVFRDRLGGAEVHAVNNLTVGVGIFSLGAAGEFDRNYATWPSSLVDVDTMAYELQSDSWVRGRAVDAGNIGGEDLTPKAEFVAPVGTRPLGPVRGNLSPGAFQR